MCHSNVTIWTRQDVAIPASDLSNFIPCTTFPKERRGGFEEYKRFRGRSLPLYLFYPVQIPIATILIAALLSIFEPLFLMAAPSSTSALHKHLHNLLNTWEDSKQFDLSAQEYTEGLVGITNKVVRSIQFNSFCYGSLKFLFYFFIL